MHAAAVHISKAVLDPDRLGISVAEAASIVKDELPDRVFTPADVADAGILAGMQVMAAHAGGVRWRYCSTPASASRLLA